MKGTIVTGHRRPADAGDGGPDRARLRAADRRPTAAIGLRARKLRAVLSAVGIAAVVGVLGLTTSSQSALLAEIDRLGTNLLTVTNGQSVTGQEVELPAQAAGMISRAGGVLHVAPTAEFSSFPVFRTNVTPTYQTNGLDLRACDPALLAALGGTVLHGTFLNAATARYPVAVLGYQAARALGIVRLGQLTRVWVADPDSATGHWLTVIGMLAPFPPGPQDRQLGPGRLPRRCAAVWLRRPPQPHLRAHPDRPDRGGRRRAGRDGLASASRQRSKSREDYDGSPWLTSLVTFSGFVAAFIGSVVVLFVIANLRHGTVWLPYALILGALVAAHQCLRAVRYKRRRHARRLAVGDHGRVTGDRRPGGSLRALISGSKISAPMWLAVSLTSVVTIGFCLWYEVKSARLPYFTVAAVVAVISAILVLSLLLEYPFSGSIEVKPTPFEHAAGELR
jgi:hypothetical protein